MRNKENQSEKRPENQKSGFLKNYLSLSVVQLANNLLPLITIPYVVRIIGQSNFGAINFVAAVILYFTLFINYGFDLTATREIAKDKDNRAKRNKVFSDVLYAKIFFLLVSIVLFAILLYTVPELESEKSLAIFNFLFVFSLVLTPNWLFQGMQELYSIAACNLIAKVLFTICIFIFITQPNDYILQPLIFSLSAIIVGIVALIYSLSRYNIALQSLNINDVVQLIWSDKSIFLSIITINLYTTFNIIALAVLQTNSDVGLYSASWKLVTVAQTLISLPLSLSLFPYIGQNFGLGRARGLDMVKKVTPFILIFTAVSVLIMWITAPYIIRIFYGEGFEESIFIFRVLCFIPLVSSLSNLLGVQTMVNLDMDRPYFFILVIGAAFEVIVGFFAVKNYSYLGASWSWLSTEVLITLILAGYLSYKDIQIFKKDYFKLESLYRTGQPFVAIIKHKITSFFYG